MSFELIILGIWFLKLKALRILFNDLGNTLSVTFFWHAQDVLVNCFKDCVEIFSKYSKETKYSILCEPFLETTRVMKNLSKNFLIHLL